MRLELNELVRRLMTAGWETLSTKGAPWLWESGLGSVRNALPDFFGRELVIVFPTESMKRAFPCFEENGQLYAVIPADGRNNEMERLVVSTPIVQLWCDDGWYSAEAKFAPSEEAEDLLRRVPASGIYGAVLARFYEDTAAPRVLVLRRLGACTGRNGPGRYAWVWAAATTVLFFRSLFRNKKDKNQD